MDRGRNSGKLSRYLIQSTFGIQQYCPASPKIRPKAEARQQAKQQPQHGALRVVTVSSDGNGFESERLVGGPTE